MKSGPEQERRKNAKQWKSIARSMARKRFNKSRMQSKRDMRKKCRLSMHCKVLNLYMKSLELAYLRRDKTLSKKLDKNLLLKSELRLEKQSWMKQKQI